MNAILIHLKLMGIVHLFARLKLILLQPQRLAKNAHLNANGVRMRIHVYNVINLIIMKLLQEIVSVNPDL